MKLVYEFTGGDCPVKLEQSSEDGAYPRFRVTYGADVHKDMFYDEAAREFGYCVFHSLACAGKLNNNQ